MAAGTGRFRNRLEAGRLLAERLRRYAGRSDVVVLGLLPGGAEVAVEVAHELGAPVDVPPRPDRGLRGHTVVLVDDGVATGSKMHTAVEAVRPQRPARVVVAVPIADAGLCAALRMLADEVVCLLTPSPLRSIAEWYDDASAGTDDDLPDLLAHVRAAAGAAAPEPALGTFQRFPVRTWRNAEVAAFLDWLRTHLEHTGRWETADLRATRPWGDP